jgi:hypothetical protein
MNELRGGGNMDQEWFKATVSALFNRLSPSEHQPSMGWDYCKAWIKNIAGQANKVGGAQLLDALRATGVSIKSSS